MCNIRHWLRCISATRFPSDILDFAEFVSLSFSNGEGQRVVGFVCLQLGRSDSGDRMPQVGLGSAITVI